MFDIAIEKISFLIMECVILVEFLWGFYHLDKMISGKE